MGAIRETFSQAGCLGYSLVEMAFVVQHGVGGFRQGVVSPLGRSPKLDDSARAFETVVFFSRPQDSFIADPEIMKNGKKDAVSLWLLPAG